MTHWGKLPFVVKLSLHLSQPSIYIYALAEQPLHSSSHTQSQCSAHRSSRARALSPPHVISLSRPAAWPRVPPVPAPRGLAGLQLGELLRHYSRRETNRSLAMHSPSARPPPRNCTSVRKRRPSTFTTPHKPIAFQLEPETHWRHHGYKQGSS